MATRPRPHEPLTSPRFIVDFPKLKGVFSEVSASAAEFETITYKFTDQRGRPGNYILPGTMKPPEITLKRGVTSDASAWEWGLEVQEGKVAEARCNGVIHLCDYDGSHVATFRVENAWPKKVTMPGPKSTANEVLVEEIVLVCEHFEREVKR
jgi:phage tail-like protein